jgi:hypothetical protein
VGLPADHERRGPFGRHIERNAKVDLFLVNIQPRRRNAAERDRGSAQVLDVAPAAGARRAAGLRSEVLSVSRDFDAWLERPGDARLVRDDAINVDPENFLGRPRAEDKRREKNHTDHSGTCSIGKRWATYPANLCPSVRSAALRLVRR